MTESKQRAKGYFIMEKYNFFCFLSKLVADDIDSTSGAQEEWTWKRTARFAGKAVYR